jgi:hypothetical protein
MINYLSFPEKANWIRENLPISTDSSVGSEPDSGSVDDFTRPRFLSDGKV